MTDGSGGEVVILPAAPKRKLRALRVAPGEKVLVRADDRPSTVWEVARDAASPEHPTQKPVALAARAILNSSKEGDRVLDVFAGAGAVVLAAEQLKRSAHLVEVSPAYVDTIVARWERLTGRKGVQRSAAAEQPARARRARP